MALTIKKCALLAVAGASAAIAVQSANAIGTKKPAAAQPKAQAGTQAASSTSLPAVPPFAPWPKAPLGGKVYRPSERVDVVGLEGPAQGLPDGDFVQVGSQVAELRGLLLYTLKSGSKYLYVSPSGEKTDIPNNHYLVMRQVGAGNQAQGSIFQGVHYHFFKWDEHRDVRLDPSGRNLFFGIGGTGQNDGFALYRWNLGTAGLNLIPGTNNVARHELSRNGEKWAVLSNTDTSLLMQPLHRPWRDNGGAWLEVVDTGRPFRYTTFGEWNKYWSVLQKYPDYSPQEEKEPLLKGYPDWRISNNAARRSVVWTSRNTLLYTHEPAKVVRRLPDQAAPQQAEEFPSIWIADPRTRANRLLIARAYDPAPSPDGRTIAFFGWPLNLKPTPAQPAPPPSLFLYDTASGRTIQATQQNSGFVLWTPDSRRLISVTFPGDDYEAHISTLDVQAALQGPVAAQAAAREVAVVKSQDFEPITRIWPLPISVAAVARNGKYLVLDISRYTGAQGSRYIEEKELQAVDLDSGQVSTIATAKARDANDPFSWSWFDLSDAPAAATP